MQRIGYITTFAINLVMLFYLNSSLPLIKCWQLCISVLIQQCQPIISHIKLQDQFEFRNQVSWFWG